MKTTLLAFVAAAVLSGARASGEGSPFEYGSRPESADKVVAAVYQKGMDAAQAGDYAAALAHFEAADKKAKDRPEVLNMLAYSQRKLGRLDEAFANYDRALKLKPRFPEAREYLAEAHLQAALRELETIKGYGPEGEKQAAALKAALKSAAEKL
jgi:tetratricopeptide (TPR) repeat protein